MEFSNRRLRVVILVVPLLMLTLLLGDVCAQGLQQTPYRSPNVLRSGGLDVAPSNPLGTPGGGEGSRGGSDTLYLSSGMFRDILGPIPNLQLGYVVGKGQVLYLELNHGLETISQQSPVFVPAGTAAESPKSLRSTAVPDRNPCAWGTPFPYSEWDSSAGKTEIKQQDLTPTLQ